LPQQTFIGVVLVVVGALGLLYLLVRLAQLLRCRSWRAADAEVVEVVVREHATSAPYSSQPGQAGEEGPTQYSAEVVYRYQAGGATHLGRTLRPVPPRRYSSRERALAAVARWPVGARVSAYCHPRDAARAVLDRSVPPWLYAGLVITAGLVIAGAIQLHGHPIVAAP